MWRCIHRVSGRVWSTTKPLSKSWFKGLAKVKPTLIVLEASGGLERQVTRALASAELPVVVVNPRQVRDFAKATGQLAKTDSIDAWVLARFGDAVGPVLRPLPEEATLEIRALTARRRQLVEMTVAEKNRLARASKSVRKGIEAHIAWLEQQLEPADNDLDPKHPSKPRLEGTGRVAQERPQHWPDYQSCTVGRTAGVGNTQSQTDLRFGRHRAAQR